MSDIEKKGNRLVKPIVFSVFYGMILFVLMELTAGPMYNENSIALAEFVVGIMIAPFLEMVLENLTKIRLEHYIENNRGALKGEIAISKDYQFNAVKYSWDRKLVLWFILALATDHFILWGGAVGILVFSVILWIRKIQEENKVEEGSGEIQEQVTNQTVDNT